jgi:TonB family protein
MRRTLLVMCLLVSLGAVAQVSPAWAQEGGEAAEDLPITKLPKLVKFVEAGYPERARADQIAEAAVVLEIDIDAEGAVEGVRVIEPAQPAGYGFDEAAEAAALDFVFEPAETSQGPVPVTITWRYRFVLEAPPVEPPPVEPPPKEEGGEVGEGGESAPAEAAPVEGPAAVVNFSGVALERGTRTPLPGVVVTVFRDGEDGEPVGFEANTDAEGRFSFYALSEGSWKVLIEPPGYFPFRTAEEIKAGEATEVVYYVEKGDYNPFDVVVEGERVRKEVNRRTITVQEIEKIPGNYGDPINVVKNLPGVARTQFGNGDIIVRGSAPEDTRVYLGSVEVPQLYHFGGLRSVVPAGMIQSIDFLPGNFSVKYGRATGGVLDVDLKALKPEKINGYVDVNLFDSGAYVEAPLGKDAAVAVAGRRSYIDAILTAVVPDNAPVDLVTAPRYYDYQALGAWRPSLDHELRFFFFGSNDSLELLFDNPSEFSTEIQGNNLNANTFFTRGIVEHSFVPNDDFRHDMLLAVGQDELSFSLGEQLFFTLEFTTVQFREEFGLKVNDEILWKLGADVLVQRGDINVSLPLPPKEGDPPGDRSLDIVRTSESTLFVLPALHSELELKPFDGTLIIPGVRLERYIYQFDTIVFDPRISVRQDLGPQWTVKGGVGLFHQPPSPDEISENFGNPELGPEAAVHYALGAEWKAPDEYPVTVDVTLFYKDLVELVSRSNALVMRDGELVPEVYNTGGSGRVYGAEFLIRHEFANNFFGWISYTLSRAERLDAGETEYRLFDFDQTHILTVLASYRLPLNWELGVRWRLVSGNPTTPVVGSVFNADTDEYERVLGGVNTARLTAFQQLDVRLDKSWIYDTWILNVYIDIQNALNQSNSEQILYNFDFSQSRDSTGLPLLPALGIKASF